MMTFYDFKRKWDKMPIEANSFLNLGMKHPLNLQIGHGVNYYKSFVIMESGRIENIPSSYAVEVTNPQLLNGNRALEFQLVHEPFEEEFLRLCWDMIEVTVDSKEPLSDMINRYMTWQKLLQYNEASVMSFERQKGLLGELLYLKEMMERMPVKDAMATWCGPDGSDQDFLFQESWTEVKTVALASEHIKISSLQQLEQEMDGELRVYTLEKSTEGADRISLPDIVSEIKNEIGDDAIILDQFDMKLFKYGYRNKDEEKYSKIFFRYIEARTYSVSMEFPKLTRKNIPAGIEECSYEISLSSIEKFRR